MVHVGTMKKRLKRGLRATAKWCREHLHAPLDYQRRTLDAKLRRPLPVLQGARRTTAASVKFHRAVRRLWRTWLSRRTRGRGPFWPRLVELLARYSSAALRASPTLGQRGESYLTNPTAVIPHGGVCEGWGRATAPPTRTGAPVNQGLAEIAGLFAFSAVLCASYVQRTGWNGRSYGQDPHAPGFACPESPPSPAQFLRLFQAA